MVEKLNKCERCKGEGSVRKYIINDYLDCIIEIISAFISSLLYFPLYCTFYGIIGSILGPIYFILLKTCLPFYIFGNIFNVLGGICIAYTIYTIFLKDKYKNLNIVFIIIFVCMGLINAIICFYLYKKKGVLNFLLNLCYISIQGGAIGLVGSYLFYKKEMLEEGNNRIKCPLCNGNKYISKNQFEKLVRCNLCNKNLGYENPKNNEFFFHKRFFCKKCSGKGYIFKNN